MSNKQLNPLICFLIMCFSILCGLIFFIGALSIMFDIGPRINAFEWQHRLKFTILDKLTEGAVYTLVFSSFYLSIGIIVTLSIGWLKAYSYLKNHK